MEASCLKGFGTGIREQSRHEVERIEITPAHFDLQIVFIFRIMISCVQGGCEMPSPTIAPEPNKITGISWE